MPFSVRTILPPPPFIPPPTRQFEYSYVEWVDPTGKAWPLTNPALGYFLADGVAGIGSVPISMAVDSHPRGGSTIRSLRSEPRIVTIPIAVAADTPTQYQQIDDDLEDAFSRTTEEGPGILRIIRPNGVERRILGTYQSGWDNGGGDDWINGLFPVQLYCPNGYFFDPTPVMIEQVYAGVSPTPYLGPGYPRVSAARAIGTNSLTNPGRVPAWPDWTITGPFSSFTAAILDDDGNPTNQTFTLAPAVPVASGESRVITSDPPTVKDGAGNDCLADLAIPGSILWALPRGNSTVSIGAAGQGVGTTVTMNFNARYKKA